MAYCLYGVINISGFNDFKTGVKFGELSKRLERSHENRKYFPFLALGYYSVIHHLIDPASQAIEHYRVAREIAVDIGEPLLADTVYNSLIQQGFWLTESPRKIFKRATETDIDIMISNQQVYSNWVYVFYQTSANLMGKENKDSPWKLDGTYLIEKTHIPYFENSHEKPAHFCYHMASLFLALLFDKDELAFTHMESCKSLLPRCARYVCLPYVSILYQFALPQAN